MSKEQDKISGLAYEYGDGMFSYKEYKKFCLGEKGITVEIVKCETYWFARTYSYENTNFNKGRFSSRKKAIPAAIDAALDYLINKVDDNE